MPPSKRVDQKGKGKAKAKGKGKAMARKTTLTARKERVQPAELATAGPAEDAAGVAAVGLRTQVDAFVEHNVVCKCCGEEISNVDAQTTGRTTQLNQIKCNKCNSTISRMQRLKLKVGALDEIDDADRIAFFQHAKELYGKGLSERHQTLLKKVTTDYDTAETSGDYLPTNVHVKRDGWTEEQIKAYDDYKDDPRLGRV